MRYSYILAGLLILITCHKIESNRFSSGERAVIYQSSKHVAFPSIEKIAKDQLICVFRAGSSHASPDGRILMCLSGNNGKSWSEPDTIVSTRLDCRDPSVTMLSDGSLIVNFFQSRYDNAGKLIGALGVYIARSVDRGKTWDAPRMIRLADYEWAACSAKIVELQNGDLLLPVYAGRTGEKSTALVLISRDYGYDWSEVYVIASDTDAELDFQEPCLQQMPDGRILCILRTAGEGHAQYMNYSDDDGRTWSRPMRINVQGQAASMLLKDNVVICAYRDFSPHATSYSLSYDFGKTFEKETIIHRHMDDRAYPEMVSLASGEIFCCYYEKNAESSGIYGQYLDIAIPGKPDGLLGSANKKISLRWNPANDAYYYCVYREECVSDSTESIFAGDLYAEVSQSWFIDNDVDSGKYYRYQVRAVTSKADLVGNSAALGEPAETRIIKVPDVNSE